MTLKIELIFIILLKKKLNLNNNIRNKKGETGMASKKDIENAWNNANIIRGKNPDVYRKDKYGRKLQYL